MPTFKIQGQVYHRIGSLLPVDGQEPQFLQIYFMGNSKEEAQRRLSVVPGTRLPILRPLQDMLHTTHKHVSIFKSNLERLQAEQHLHNHKIVIRPDKAPIAEHPRTFNAPETNEVAVLIVGQNSDITNRDIVLQQHDNRLQRVNEIHPWYDALQYPLLFPNGEDGYNIHLRQVNPETGLATNAKVSAMDFYAYRIMARANSFNRLLRARMLFHQFLVDVYAKVETERLDFIRFNQRQLRAAEYVHLKDAVDRQGANNDASNIGQAIILPSSFTGSPRYMHEHTQDAMTYVRKHGRPDLFITMTCNPQWNEITCELMEGQKHDHRHDLTARVFHLKLKKLMDLYTLLHTSHLQND